jgi:hypothetical protein
MSIQRQWTPDTFAAEFARRLDAWLEGDWARMRARPEMDAVRAHLNRMDADLLHTIAHTDEHHWWPAIRARIPQLESMVLQETSSATQVLIRLEARDMLRRRPTALAA